MTISHANESLLILSLGTVYCMSLVSYSVYMARYEKTMLMHTKYTSLHYLNYLLTFCLTIWFSIGSWIINKSTIDTLCLNNKLLKLKFQKSCVHISTVFSYRVTASTEETITLPHAHCWVPGCTHMNIIIWQKVYWQILQKQVTIRM